MKVTKPSKKRTALSTKNILEDTMYRSEMIRRKNIGTAVKSGRLHERFLALPLQCNRPKEGKQ